MPGISQCVSLLLLVNIVLTAAAAVAIYRRNLARTYRVFFVYLLFVAAQWSLLFGLPRGGHAYFWAWVITQPAIWVFHILLVLELFRLVLQNHKGIERLGRWVFHSALGAAVLFSVITADLAGAGQFTFSRILPYLFLISRSVAFAVLLSLFALVLFLILYPVRLPRNLIVHSFTFAIYYVSATSGFFLLTQDSALPREYANLILVAITTVSMGIWLLLLKPAGEHRPRSMWTDVLKADPEPLLRRLDAFNAALVRSFRK